MNAPSRITEDSNMVKVYDGWKPGTPCNTCRQLNGLQSCSSAGQTFLLGSCSLLLNLGEEP